MIVTNPHREAIPKYCINGDHPSRCLAGPIGLFLLGSGRGAKPKAVHGSKAFQFGKRRRPFDTMTDGLAAFRSCTRNFPMRRVLLFDRPSSTRKKTRAKFFARA